MNPNKLLQEKKQFIQWFLETQALKNTQCTRVLQTLLQSDALLIQSKFVTDISGYQNALLISAEGTDAQPFVCRVGGSYFHLVEEAIPAILNTSCETIYICLYFKKCFPCTCSDLITDPTQHGNEDFMQVVEQEMQQYLWQKELKKREIMIAIDASLDHGDKNAFINLTEKLKRL